MEAGRPQQTRKGNADDLQPDVSLDLEIHSWKSMKELLLNMDLEQTGMRKSLDERSMEVRPQKKQYTFRQKTWNLGLELDDTGHNKLVTWARQERQLREQI